MVNKTIFQDLLNKLAISNFQLAIMVFRAPKQYISVPKAHLNFSFSI